MTGEPARAADRVRQLRHVFDSAFSQAVRSQAPRQDDVLAIRVGPDPYALRLNQVSGLVADKAVTRLPAADPALLGIAGFRGTIVSVYDLRCLLGYPGGGPPRWMVLTAMDPTVGLAFDQFEGHWRVDQEALVGEEGAEHPSPHARELVRLAEVARPVIQIPSVLDAIQQRVRTPAVQKER